MTTPGPATHGGTLLLPGRQTIRPGARAFVVAEASVNHNGSVE